MAADDQPLAALPLADDGANSLEAWKTRIDASQKTIERLKDEQWDRNLDRYLAKKPLAATLDTVIVPKDYANVEQKKAQLFFQVPDVQLEAAEPLAQGKEDAIAIFEKVLDFQLGPHGVNVETVIDENLTDGLCPAGIFASKIGYEATVDGTKSVQVGQQPDPNWIPPTPDQVQPGAVLGLNQPLQTPPMIPQMQDVPNIIAEHYIWERISPAKLLIPDEFHGSDFEKAPWLGFEFLLPFNVAKRAFNLPDDFDSFVTDDKHVIGKRDSTSGDRDAPKRVKGYEIWYKAAIFDETVKHPDQLRVLVLIDGLDDPVKHEDSPYQTKNPDGTLGGMEGFPILVGALRYVSDRAIPPSDCQMSSHLLDEQSRIRTQQMEQRRRNTPIRYGPIGLGPEFYAKVEKNITQMIIPIPDEHFQMYGNEGPLRALQQSQLPRENFEIDNIIDRDIATTWALDSNQRGLTNEAGDHTATELTLAQQSSNIRMDKERNKFLSQYFARGVAKLGALLQMFADQQQYVSIVGSDGMQRLQAWDKTTIQGKFLYKVRPNSSLRVDVAQERSQALQLYNLLMPSPFVNQQKLSQQTLQKFDLDPAELGAQPQPKPAEIPKISYSFTGQDLNPANPQFSVVAEILRQNGIPVDDQAIQASQRAADAQGLPSASAVPHGSPVPPPPATTIGNPHPGPVNKHQEERTGAPKGPKLGGMAA